MKFTFIDWDSVSNTISRIHHDTSGTSRGVQSEHSLDGNIHGRGVERLEHNLCHLFSVSFRVKGGLCQEDWVFLWGYTELVVESMMPDLLHIIPVGDNSMLDWVLQGEDTSLALSLIANIAVFLSHTDHDTLMSGTSYDGGEDSTRSIISSEASLVNTRPIVNHH